MTERRIEENQATSAMLEFETA
uniref:Uncharacterized protein n=1 Tax=Physcomitrium patens TaxID=3218 RepID=A0A2K1JU67_PHYPA|nr:hypothetical protein PHYPA_014840 [Physcomitrium patens]